MISFGQDYPDQPWIDRDGTVIADASSGVLVDDGNDKIFPSPAAPMAVARRLYRGYQLDGMKTLLCWRGEWMTYTGTHWTETDQAELRGRIYNQLEHVLYEQEDKKKGTIEIVPFNPNKRKIADVLEAMRAVGHLSSKADPPQWMRKAAEGYSRAPAREIVSCTNGLLHVPTKNLLPHTPTFFSTVAVPFEYLPDAPAPRTWLNFLGSIWPDDPDSISLLQEYTGYILSGRTDMQKALLLIGPTRSGKGTYARMLGSLVGAGNAAGPTLASLGTNFGLSPLLGKPLAIVSDARLGSAGASTVVERLLSITGEDMLTVDRKFKDPWSGKLPSRFVILSNELPRFGDASGAVANRFLILQMTKSFLGKEDRTLDRRLHAELPGILSWALEGLDRLTRNGHFTVPQSAQDAATLMMDLASPISAFVRDRCVRHPQAHVLADDLFDAWRTWCEDNGHHAGSKVKLGRDLNSVAPDVGRSQPVVNGKRVSGYVRIGLRADYEDIRSSALNADPPVHPVQRDESAGQRALRVAADPVHERSDPVHTASDAQDCTGCGEPEKTANPLVNGICTGCTGESAFKAEPESKSADPGRLGRCPECGFGSLGDRICVDCRRKAEARSADAAPTIPCVQWTRRHAEQLMAQGVDTIDSRDWYTSGQEAGYKLDNLRRCVMESDLISTAARSGRSVTFALGTGGVNTVVSCPDWLGGWLCKRGWVLASDAYKAGGQAGYERATIKSAAKRIGVLRRGTSIQTEWKFNPASTKESA